MTGYLIGGGILAVIVAAIYFNRAGFREGSQTIRARDLDKGLKGVGDAKKADDAVARLPAGGVSERLSKWRRD
jgi:hypothetical protein